MFQFICISWNANSFWANGGALFNRLRTSICKIAVSESVVLNKSKECSACVADTSNENFVQNIIRGGAFLW